MNKQTLLLIATFFVLIPMIFQGCKREPSNDVNQDKIFTVYELFYNGNEDKTYARASFRFSNITGTLLELVAPSEVRFNNDILTFNTGLAYYEKEYAGFINTGTFRWINLDDDTFTNSISVYEIDYPAGLDSISRAGSYELFWQGDSLSQYHDVVMTADGINENDTQIFNQDDLNSKSIILALNKLQILPNGPATFYMDRNYKPGLTEFNTAGGIITGRYRPINIVVELY